MGKKNVCPRCGGPLRFDAQCIQPACRNLGADMRTPVVAPPDSARPSDIPTQAPPTDPNSIPTLPAERDPESPVDECPICHNLMRSDGQCRNATCIGIQQALQNVGSLNAYSEPPSADAAKDCIPPMADSEEPIVAEEPLWIDHGHCLRCNFHLEMTFIHCPKCGLIRHKHENPYAIMRTGIPAAPLPGASNPPARSTTKPLKPAEYSFVDPAAANHRRKRHS